MAGIPHRTRALLLGWIVFVVTLVLVLAPAAPVEAKEWESEEHNVIVTIPDQPNPWDWLPYNAAWQKQGIVKGAKRELTKLKSGAAATGQGALLHVAVRDAEEGLKVGALAEHEAVREFLTARFQDHGDIESDNYAVPADGSGEHPCVVLRTKGEAFNLKGKKGACEGILLATVARGKLHLVRLYAFPTEYDDEGLTVDIDYMEGNCFALVTAKEKKKAAPKKGAPDGGGPQPEDGGEDEEEGEEEIIEHRAQRWRLVKHKKLTMQEITEEDKEFFLVFKCGDSDQMGSYNFYIYAPPTVQYINGQAAPPANILKWITTDWWNHFNNTHPKGELATFKWPKKPATKGAKTFMTIPDVGDEKARKVVIKDGEKRPVEVSASDVIKKLKFVEKVKAKNIGKKGKVSEAVRGCMQGKRPRTAGMETVFRWAFRYRAHSYRVFVTFTGQAHRKWGDAIRQTLESWEFGIKYKD